MKLNRNMFLTGVLLSLAVMGCSKKSASSGTSSSPAKEQPSAESAATAANLSGTWKWTAPTNPDGKTPNITFTLNLQGETVTGTVNMSTSTDAITNGVVKGDEVSFQTIREGKAGQATITYSGKISGDTIKGTVETAVGDRKFGPKGWEADRVKK